MGDHEETFVRPAPEIRVIAHPGMEPNKALLMSFERVKASGDNLLSLLDGYFGNLKKAKEKTVQIVNLRTWNYYPCKVWKGKLNRNGYGVIQVGRSRVKAMVHRLAYELHVGPIPKGKQLDHLCRNRACWEPNHLEPVTNRENTIRGFQARKKK